MSDTDLTDDELDQLLLGAHHHLAVRDHQAAYDLLADRHEAGGFQGERYGRASLYLGEACAGLDAWDAAAYYFEQAQQFGSSEVAGQAATRLAEVGRLDRAVDAVYEGVSGEQEADATLAAADDALARFDYDNAWQYYSYAYDGLQLSEAQVARAAIGMAWCCIQADELDRAEGYLDVALNRDAATARQGVDDARARIAELRGGEQALADGVQLVDLNELHAAARAAAASSDFDSAQRYLEQMYHADDVAGTERARIAYNLGLLHLWRHEFETSRTYFQEAESGATSYIRGLAVDLLRELDDIDRAHEIADRSRNDTPLAEPGE